METETQPFQLFQRGATYWVRFSIKGQGQQRFSLGTKDAALAQRLAQQKYQHSVWSADQGLLAGKTSFDKLAQQYIEELLDRAKANPKKAAIAKAEKAIIDRYLVAFFGKSTVTSIAEPKLHEYLQWRKAYWVTGPGAKVQFVTYDLANGKQGRRKVKHEPPHPNTVRREASALRGVLNFAVRLGYLRRGDVPELRLEAGKKNKRPAFTTDEINTILNAALERLQDAFAQPKLRHERVGLYAFITVAVETGMRPTELYNLNWAHIVGFESERGRPLGERRIRIDAYGKGMAPRQMVPKRGAFSAFEHLWDAFVATHGRAPGPNDPVFTNHDGERIGSIKRSLNNLLEATGMKADAFGRPRTAYSFRHTYATNQIRDGVDVYMLAINMRTSVRMIEMYYSDIIPEDRAKLLEGNS
ncbi:Phage integrase family protein [Devosia crocina]|uniref:Phage integrase family protein n=1 Tax=Devosia crocina TaxID=429728 RepID=A0A1I7NPM6_9HYPH|nr:site-specific integrase [Devosia crocina]SFV36573.1 Phage integrase family protein [Devosia crocina]